MPTEIAIGSPIADQTEYLPPTQSQMGKILSLTTPKSVAPRTLLVIAMKCLSIASLVSDEAISHFFANNAFCAVSKVLKDLEATIKSVVSGLSVSITSSKCVGSKFDTKCIFKSLALKSTKASHTNSGPKSEPPIPIFTMSLIFWPVNPFHSPEWMLLTVLSIFLRQSVISLFRFALAGMRKAVCKTDRSSEVLILSP